ncbi:MAG: hypothetical protein EOP09_10865 [Proteobacteria bacterium]|nr:MAG: hypothetical protein EOP09_10865 [Pseudomonadota bacterium]
MTMNPLPPQAYTKDTLTKAYMWLVHQNASIKELATTPDILVSLFLKAQRNGDESLDTPSIQNFKNELKSLASMMGDLGPAPAETAPPVQRSFHAQSESAPPPPRQQQTQQTQHSHQHAHQSQQAQAQQVQVHVHVPQGSSAVSGSLSQLDSKSQFMVNELREQLNLSSDIEVLRLLISLGYNKAKNLYS